jgi:hypothetical protein
MALRYLRFALVLGVIVVFVPWWVVVLARERNARQSIELFTPFTQPVLDLRFSKKITYDPLSFVGRGRVAGFWEWSPDGLILTPKGANIFTDFGDDIGGKLIAGKRRVDSIRSVQTHGTVREVRFRYVWAEITEPTAKLLNKPPKSGEDYEATATQSLEGGVWKTTTVKTEDFEKAVDLLMRQATGALR